MATETFTLTLDNTPSESVSVTINDTSVPTEVLINEQLEIEQSRSFVNAIDTTFEFKPDGTVLWVGTTGSGPEGDERIIEYSLSTAWDLSTATATGNVLDVDTPGDQISVSSMVVNPEGTRLFIAGAKDTTFQERIQQYNIGTAWDLSTHNSVPNYNFNLPNWGSTRGTGQMFFEPDGRKIWIAMYDNFGTHYINRYDLFSAWSLSGYSTGQSVALSGSGSSQRPEMVTYNHDGTVFAFQRSVNNGIEVFELSTAYGWNANSTRTRFVRPAIVSGSTVLTGLTRIKFYDDGKKMFAATGSTIFELRNGSYETQRAYVRDNGTCFYKFFLFIYWLI